MKIRIFSLASIMILSILIGAAKPAIAGAVYKPGESINISRNYDCEGMYSEIDGWEVTAYVRDAAGYDISWTALEVSVTQDFWDECTNVAATGVVDLPTDSGSYKLAVQFNLNGETVYEPDLSFTISGGTSEVKISNLSWAPAIKVDVPQMPWVTVNFRMKNRETGDYDSSYCPKKITLQFRSMGGAWRVIKIYKKSVLTCSKRSKFGYQNLTYQAPGRGYLRVKVDDRLTSAKSVKIVKALDKFRFTYLSSNRKYVHWVGDNAYVGAYLEQKLTNGLWAAPSAYAGSARLQKYENGSWVVLKKCRHFLSGKWTYTECGPVSSVVGLKLRIVYLQAVTEAVTFTPKVVTLSGLYISGGWPSCSYSNGMKVYAGAKGNNGRHWPRSVKIVLQFRASRYSSWTNIDFAYSNKYQYATLYNSNCYTNGWYRLYSPETGKVLESGYYS